MSIPELMMIGSLVVSIGAVCFQIWAIARFKRWEKTEGKRYRL